MTLWSCATCGIEYADTPQPPAMCPICSDDRQYLPAGGQQWTTQSEIAPGRSAQINELEPGLYEIIVTPKFGIGHRSLLVQTPNGNLLWDVSGFFDDALIASLQELGGVAAIACSHPHLTGAQVSVSQRFGSVPIYWNEDDRRWIQRPDEAIALWSGTREVLPGLTLVQCGGHFAGSSVLHFTGADGQGVILTGDTIRVNADRTTVSFMRSYPNLIPLSPRSIGKIVDAVTPWSFDRIYGGFDGELLASGGAEAVRASAERYIGWLRDEIRDPDER
ncbi:MBL fold metallo-hydrolase [soil metagenome]